MDVAPPTLGCFPFFLCQKEEDGLCREVVQSQTRHECSGIPAAQWKSPTDGARHASLPLFPLLTARRYSNRMERWHCYSPVWGLNVDEGSADVMVFCKSTPAACVWFGMLPHHNQHLSQCLLEAKKNKIEKVRWKENSASALLELTLCSCQSRMLVFKEKFLTELWFERLQGRQTLPL